MVDTDEKMQKYSVRSKHPGNEMGNRKHACSEVTMSDTGSPDWQGRDIKGMPLRTHMSLHELHILAPLALSPEASREGLLPQSHF